MAGDLAWAGDNKLKLELDDQERRAVGKSLVERRGRLIENVEDTTQSRATRRSGLLELKAIASVRRKLRAEAVRAHEVTAANGVED
jgi:hypothetical protein